MQNQLPTEEQVKRLQALQGVDAGVFTLAVFSVIEAYIRDSLGVNADQNTTFHELVEMFQDFHGNHGYKENKLFQNIRRNHRNTNYVRHNFGNLSAEEANGAVSLLKDFASMFCLPNLDRISVLTRRLDSWNARKSPAETAVELEKANREIERLSKLNGNMAEKAAQFDERQKELERLETQLKAVQLDYDQQLERGKKDKEKIDELRQKKHLAEEESRKAQKELRAQLANLSDAKDYIENLSRMVSYTRTRYDYEQGLVRLTAEQESIVKQVNFGRDFLVKGSAGTGKSLVLLKTLEKLLLDNEGRLFQERESVALITFSRSLEKYNRYVARLMDIRASSAPDDGESGKAGDMIMTSESFLVKILKDAFPGAKLTYGNERCLEDTPCIKDNPLGTEIWAELDRFILPGFVSRDEYCGEGKQGIKRTGMRKPLATGARAKVWEAVEAIFSEWEKREAQPVPYLTYKLLRNIDGGEYSIPESLKVDYLFVDETQDLTAASLRVLRLATRKSMILAGDNDQSVFQPGFTWSRAGISVSGNTRMLHINFRSTDQINSVAERYRALITGCDTDNVPQTFRMGPPVELHENKSQEESFRQMADTVRLCVKSLGYEPENICLIAPKKAQLEKLKNLLKDELDLDCAPVNAQDFDFAKPRIVRLATPQSCKGLDFPVVLFYLDHRAGFLYDFEESVFDKMNRNMVYTALTRSMELLHVFMPESVSDGPLGDLKKLLKGEL